MEEPEPYHYDGKSVLASNMAQESSEMETFPVLVGDMIEHFHSVSGGYSREHQLDVVNLIHEVQGPGSPSNHNYPDRIEAHLDENYYSLSIVGKRECGNYPDGGLVVSILVDDYTFGPHSFSEAMSASIDSRETRYDSN